jgi:hypothetical protein
MCVIKKHQKRRPRHDFGCSAIGRKEGRKEGREGGISKTRDGETQNRVTMR